MDRVYQVIENVPNPCFRRFGESVSAARRAGDVDPDKAIIADTMKLLGNSGYGKTVTNVDRHRDVKYCTEIGTSALINNKRFRQLDVVTEEIEMNKSVVKYTLPSTPHRFLRLPVRQTTHATVLLRLCRQIRRTTAVSVLRDGHRLGIHCAGWRKHRWTRQGRSSCALLPTQIPMASGRMLRQTRRRLCPCSATESCCFARKAFDKRTPGLFKVEWC